MAIPGVSIYETEEDIANLIRYANEPITTKWGKLRAANGHPEPYQLTHLQIGNEETLDQNYVERFTNLGKSVWSVDPGITLLVSHNLKGESSLYKIGADGQLSENLKLVKQMVRLGAENNGAIWWDCHYYAESLHEFDLPKNRFHLA